MRGLKPKTSYSIKIGLIIAAFSLVIAIVLIGVLLFSQRYMQPQSGYTATMLYPIEGSDITLPNSSVTIAPDKITTSSEIYQASVLHFISQLMPLAIFLGIFLFGALFCLWLMLTKVQEKQMEAVTKSVVSLDAAAELSHIPSFAAAIEAVRQQYQDNLNDYKRLTSYLSHEQKNALAILRTNVELSPNPVYLRNLDYLAAGIDDILTLAETEGEEIVGSVDVSLVCAAVCDSYKKITDTITFSFDEMESTEVAAKQRWIYRAVSNLVDNAVKYGNGKPIEVGVRAEKHSVIVTVKDNGIGIPKEKQEKIFADRYRVNEQKNDGYGIGLSLVSHVCDLCGGYVALESEIGVGTNFYLSFPALTVD